MCKQLVLLLGADLKEILFVSCQDYYLVLSWEEVYL